MKKITLVAISILVLFGVILLVFNHDVFKKSADTQTTEAISEKKSQTQVAPKAEEVVSQFIVSGGSFYFDPNEIRVKKGETVKITFINKEGFHDFVIDELNVRTKKIKGGDSETVEFTANKIGTFEYYCSVGTHRQMGMKGNLIVE